MNKVYGVSDFVNGFNTIVEDNLSEYYDEYSFVWIGFGSILNYLKI